MAVYIQTSAVVLDAVLIVSPYVKFNGTQCFLSRSARGPLLAYKTTKDPHILAQVNIMSRRERAKIKDLYLRTDFGWLRIHSSSIRDNALHDLTLIKITVNPLVDTGCFLVIYCYK